jgi:hypothetical protein
MVFFILADEGFEQSKSNYPVDSCCHQCKHWWLPLFSPTKVGANANESPILCQPILLCVLLCVMILMIV